MGMCCRLAISCRCKSARPYWAVNSRSARSAYSLFFENFMAGGSILNLINQLLSHYPDQPAFVKFQTHHHGHSGPFRMGSRARRPVLDERTGFWLVLVRFCA